MRASKIQHLKISELCQFLEKKAPLHTAESWDNVGLLSGDSNAPYKGAVISIDLTEAVLDFAIESKVNFILNHHPIVFPKGKGLNSITAEGQGKLLYKAIQNGISIYAAHTNFDRSAVEAMEWLSESLGFKKRATLPSEPKDLLGFGFVADRKTALTQKEFKAKIFKTFGVEGFITSLPEKKEIKRIGFVPGKGSSFLSEVKKAKCDVFITGETGFHVSREGTQCGIQVIEVGHPESEIAFLKTTENWLKSFKKQVHLFQKPLQKIITNATV